MINFNGNFPFCFADAFDVYNIETALPVIDLDAIEALMASAQEEDKKVSHTLYWCILILRTHKLVRSCQSSRRQNE